MDIESIKYFTGLGVGGALAFITLLFYRKDFIKKVDEGREQISILLEVVRDNTEAMTALKEEIHNLRKK